MPIFTQELHYRNYLPTCICLFLHRNYKIVTVYYYQIIGTRFKQTYCFSTWTKKTFQMQHMWCKLYKNGTDPNLENCSFLKKGSHSNYKWCMYCGYILFQTQKCSYWGKCNPNLDNCSYCEGRKPYYILTNFLLLLTCYYFNLVELRNLLHPFPNTKMSILGKMQSQSG